MGFSNKKIFSFWFILLFAAGWAGVALAQGQATSKASLDADGRGFTFEIPKIMTFRGSFSATLVRDAQTRELLSTMGLPEFKPGQTHVLNSAEGVLLATPEAFTEETPCARATGKEVALRFDRVQLDLLIRLSQVAGISGFQVQTGVRNSGPTPVRLLSLSPVVMEGRVPSKPESWLVTALNTSVKVTPPVVALSEISQPLTVFECGGFYSAPNGNGFLFGPVGMPNAYVQASIEHKGDRKVAFTYTAEMSGVQVKPGETRWGQQVGLFAEPTRLALPHWARWVAKTHKARTDKGSLSGWNSYSFHGGNITGKDVLADVETVLKNPDRFRPMVMEIDTGYEQKIDKSGINTKFLEGMPFYAQRIAETGARPGILLNFQGPPGFETTANRVREMVKGGFTYLKINRTFLRFEDDPIPSKTSFEKMREGFTKLREAAGEGTYLLYNNSTPDRATVGLVDANRTGVDSRRISPRNAVTDVLRSCHLNARWFAVDPDSYYMGTDIANVSEIAGGWPMVRTWMSMVGLSCGAALTSDPWHWESFQRYWRNVEVMTPPACEETVVMDLCTSLTWPRLVGHVKRPWGDHTVALLWNTETSERIVTLDFERAGMNMKHRYAVWSFWDNRYLGVTKGSWKTPALGPNACQHLCFTDLDQSPDKPVLIGSGLHIYCGAPEINKVFSSRSRMEIELTDAGARGGSLFIYSRRQPVWKAAEGCTVAEIASAGENVWRIQLADRTSGVAQMVKLEILLPVTEQIWFWALIGTVLLSLLLAAWRYLTALRLQREHALDRERGRIARDIHDDLGTSLTRISVLAENATTQSCDWAQVQEYFRTVRDVAQEMTCTMDEIVWAINPSHDSLDSLATYFGSYAAQAAKEAGLRCRLDFPMSLPVWKLSAEKRHHLFLAFKEAVGNVLKHAHATEMKVGLIVTADGFELFVEDNGRGLPDGLGEAGSKDGNGIVNMHHRMTQLNGAFRIASPAGGGTRITFAISITALQG